MSGVSWEWAWIVTTPPLPTAAAAADAAAAALVAAAAATKVAADAGDMSQFLAATKAAAAIAAALPGGGGGRPPRTSGATKKRGTRPGRWNGTMPGPTHSGRQGAMQRPGRSKREHTVQEASRLIRLRLDRTMHRPMLTLECSLRSRPNELQVPPRNFN
jgi:hypothetical protein